MIELLQTVEFVFLFTVIVICSLILFAVLAELSVMKERDRRQQEYEQKKQELLDKIESK